MSAAYRFEPVGLDVWDRRQYQPEPGTLVRKVQPHGCPRNGTFGHCYVVPLSATTDDRGRWSVSPVLVLVNSLTKTKRS